jgi:hypothetical protein
MSNSRAFKHHEDSIIPDPLHLADIYARGLAKIWNNKSEAARILGITYPGIRRHHLIAAESLAQLPREVLDLFKDVGLGTWAWRRLSNAKKLHGLPTLLERAHRIKTIEKEFTRAELVRMLSSAGRLHSDAPSRFNPSKLSRAYERGVKKGRWSTFHGAGEVLGIDKGVIAVASNFSKLPSHIRRLFETEATTYDNCRAVLELEKVYGRAALVHRARSLPTDAQKTIPPCDIIRLLTGMVHQNVTVTPRVKISRNKREIVVELHCKDSRFLLDRSSELLKLVAKGFTSYVEAAIASDGTTTTILKKYIY